MKRWNELKAHNQISNVSVMCACVSWEHWIQSLIQQQNWIEDFPIFFFVRMRDDGKNKTNKNIKNEKYGTTEMRIEGRRRILWRAEVERYVDQNGRWIYYVNMRTERRKKNLE